MRRSGRGLSRRRVTRTHLPSVSATQFASKFASTYQKKRFQKRRRTVGPSIFRSTVFESAAAPSVANLRSSTGDTPAEVFETLNKDLIAEPYSISEHVKLLYAIEGGTFSYLFVGSHKLMASRVAVKCIELGSDKDKLAQNELVMQALRGRPGFCQYICSGIDIKSRSFKFLVMELLGPNLLQLKEYIGRPFSERTILLLAIQMLRRLEFLHQANIIHRNINPSNFAMGCNEDNFNVVYLIDFSISKFARIPHAPQDDFLETVVGSPEFCSMSAHKTRYLMMRDDLESFFYTVFYLFKGYLPWSKIFRKNNISDRVKSEKIYQLKEKLNAKRLCGETTCLVELHQYIRSLHWNSTPDYRFLIQLLFEYLQKRWISNRFLFDWTKHYIHRYKYRLHDI